MGKTIHLDLIAGYIGVDDKGLCMATSQSFGSRVFMKWRIIFTGLCLFLALTVSVSAIGAFVHPVAQRPVILKQLFQAQVVYLGETHDHPPDHEAQLEILQKLYARKPNLAIALEMFQKPFQAKLDQYLKGTLAEAELLSQTEYSKRWGFNWDFYAPILRFAKANRIPLIAINTPSEVTRKVAQTGLESLAPEDFQWIPPLSEIDATNIAYRERLQKTYQSFHNAHGNSDGFDRFFQAQVLWDETMADAIAQYWLTHRDRKIVALVGQGHLLYGDGIPARVQRRLKAIPDWQPYSVLLNPAAELQSPQSRPVADSFWFTSTQP
jgi:uncharacterized iron-regulated protein